MWLTAAIMGETVMVVVSGAEDVDGFGGLVLVERVSQQDCVMWHLMFDRFICYRAVFGSIGVSVFMCVCPPDPGVLPILSDDTAITDSTQPQAPPERGVLT